VITITHDVTSSFYRSPKGAVATGTQVTLRLLLSNYSDSIHSVRLFYVYGLESFSEGYVLMRRESCEEIEKLAEESRYPDDAVVFSADIRMNDEPGLFFYWFEVRFEDGRYRWGFPDKSTEGMKARTLKSSPSFRSDGSEVIPGFQITVHVADFQTPDWMKGAVLYQIFPDRYNRGSQFDETKALEEMRFPERIWHSDWSEEVDIAGKEPEGYEACDFYGGTLSGITEKLESLAEIGVTVLYLNPVLKAKSNHRYDTGDYLNVDPLLGSNEDLLELFEKARDLGIRVIMDGVFSHTGSDSLYFNRYDRYDSVGAWQEKRDGTPSPYTSWFRFDDDAEKRMLEPCMSENGNMIAPYECWWDFHSLPNVHEDDLTYREFICGPDGVLARWLRAGCSGVRLDVSDELPDSFLRLLRRRVKAENPDAFILGEIWEEPTARISYGHYRDFLFGRTHDAVMGYAFRKYVIDFLKGNTNAITLRYGFEHLCTVTPFEALFSQMNLLGSHDTKRIITKLAGVPQPPKREDQIRLTLSSVERKRGKELVLAGMLLQLAFPGAMAVYYGDELGMEGYEDPFNRRTYPWGTPEGDFTARVRRLMKLRASTPVLRTGRFEVLEADRQTIAMRRYLTESGEDVFGRQVLGPNEVVVRVTRTKQGATGSIEINGEIVYS
jgi:cyclomaltodextrinase